MTPTAPFKEDRRDVSGKGDAFALRRCSYAKGRYGEEPERSRRDRQAHTSDSVRHRKTFLERKRTNSLTPYCCASCYRRDASCQERKPSTHQIVTHHTSPGWRMWAPSAAMMSCGVLAYIDRQTLAVLSPTILQDTGLSAEAYATALSAFSFAYMIGNPLWGSFLDFVGLRLGMILAVTLWTMASVSHAWVGGLVGLLLARAVLGFGEGAAFPGGLRTSLEALPRDRQGRGCAFLQRLLARIADHALIVVPIALRFGWRALSHDRRIWRRLADAVVGGRPAAALETHQRTSLTSVAQSIRRRAWVVVSSFGLGAVALGVVAYLARCISIVRSA